MPKDNAEKNSADFRNSGRTEKQYSKIRKKYKLPEFNELNKELEITSIEETDFLLRAITRKISEKIDFYASLIEEVLQPDTSNLYAMHETRSFSQEEKNMMYDLYGKLMKLARESVEMSLDNTEQNEAKFISSFFAEWKSIKQELLVYVRKMKSSWINEVDIKEDIGYLG